MIQGEVAAKNNFLLIRFDNPYDAVLSESKDGLYETTKSDTKQHGYGLKSIRMTAEKYGGTVKIVPEDGWFSIKIMIPIP